MAALSAILDEAAVEQAASLYDLEFADQPTLSVAELVGRLDANLGLGPRKKVAYKALTAAVQGKSPTPGAVSAVPAPAGGTGAGGSDAGSVFGFLVREIVSRCKHRDVSSVQGLSRHVSEAIPQLTLSPAAEQGIRSWVADPERFALGSQGSDEEMKRLLQNVYLWSCDWFGPVDTDRIFADAVRTAEQLPAAANFSPRNFL